VREAIKKPVVAEKLKSIGATPVWNTPEEFSKSIKEDIAKWRAIVEKSGVQVE
jgi:tripartite-type tricarboxylate transporter receptor subunit TctC